MRQDTLNLSRPGSRLLDRRCTSRASSRVFSRAVKYDNRSNNSNMPDSMLSANINSMLRANRSSELTALSSSAIFNADTKNIDNKSLNNSSTTFLPGKGAFVPSDVFVCLPKENSCVKNNVVIF